MGKKEYENLIGTNIIESQLDEMLDYYPLINKDGLIIDIVSAKDPGYVVVDFVKNGGIINIGFGTMAVIVMSETQQ